ncbi:hypothetical protein DFH07DRAFT_1058192 [Mycena maculata]|uniref:Uncharacterized protein n=1 Tax=Mycena maculata TaxID=230809 RepID=A0AAD7JS85_9AGAR|nr:hypothetical protein DFH07DRAFT_1058192 [Mycena maculata]
MYLPTSFWLQPGVPNVATSYFLGVHGGSGDDDDRFAKIYKTVVRWISKVFTAFVNWLDKTCTAVLAWIHDDVGPWLADAAVTASQPLKQHPHAALIISALIFLGPQVFLLPLLLLQGVCLLLLTVLGFGVNGIIRGSPAAGYQSLCYGGNTPTASLFAILQSLGMKYHVVTLGNWFLATPRPGAQEQRAGRERRQMDVFREVRDRGAMPDDAQTQPGCALEMGNGASCGETLPPQGDRGEMARTAGCDGGIELAHYRREGLPRARGRGPPRSVTDADAGLLSPGW